VCVCVSACVCVLVCACVCACVSECVLGLCLATVSLRVCVSICVNVSACDGVGACVSVCLCVGALSSDNVALCVCGYCCTVLLFETNCPQLVSTSLASNHGSAVEVRQNHAADLGGGLGGATSHDELDETALTTCTSPCLDVNGLQHTSQRLYCRTSLSDLSLISHRLSFRSYSSDYLVSATVLSLKSQRHQIANASF
jgi:hypothetical protein